LTREQSGATVQIYGRSSETSAWTLKASGRYDIDPVQMDWLYEIEWQPKAPAAPKAKVEAGHWIVFCDHTGMSEKLVSLLGERGGSYTLVFAGEQYEAANGSITINPTRPEDFNRLIESVVAESKALKGVAYLWTLNLPTTDKLDENVLQQAEVFGAYSPLYLVQSLAARTWSNYPRLWVVTQGVQPVLGADIAQLALAQSPVWGFGRTVSVEQPDFWGGLVDIQAAADVDTTAQNILVEILNTDSEDQIAFREGQRYVARLVRSRDLTPQSASLNLRPDATYLITGGLGGIGLEVARGLVKQGARHLVLMGRRGANDTVKPVLAELEASGAQVLVAAADISKPEDVERVLADIDRTMPPLRGVIHSAAVADPGIIIQQNGDRYAKMLPPKIEGTWNLHRFTQHLPLDFFILFSSGASILGLAGESGYAAGNAFLDAFSVYRRSLGLPAMTINWGVWAEVGLAVGLSDFFNKIGFGLMQVDNAVATLGYVMRAQALHHLVADVHWQTFRQMHETRRERMMFEQMWAEMSGTSATVSSAPEVPFAEQLQSLPPAEQWQRLLERVRKEAARVLGFDATLLDIRGGFFKIGMDSLMSVQLRNRLEASLNSSLPPTIALEYPTVESLTRYVYDEVFHLGQTATAEPQPEEAAAPDQLGDLSQDELASLLDDELAAIDDLIGDDE
jgi:acyl carrier protein